MKQWTIKVKGMVCGGCENRIQTVLTKLPGVETVIANHETGEVLVTAKDNLDFNLCNEKIESLGFEVVKESKK